jgi:hypothetical protein
MRPDFWSGILEGGDHLKIWLQWGDNIKIDLWAAQCGYVHWIHLAQVNKVVDLRFV